MLVNEVPGILPPGNIIHQIQTSGFLPLSTLKLRLLQAATCGPEGPKTTRPQSQITAVNQLYSTTSVRLVQS